MRIVRSPAAMRALSARARRQGLSVGFVPTMGALHAGHASLVRRARKENARVVVSVFVNPLQFGPKEDYRRYPRAFARDAALCRKAGADFLYHPGADAMYPEGFRTRVEVDGADDLLCGRFRPGHFRGVATVVLKLLETARPDRAYFGEKDYQQLVVIRRMVRDLGAPVRVIGCPTVREPDGLALSSRNAYLGPEERAAAPGIYRALRLGSALARQGLGPRRVERRMRAALRRIPGARIDYAELVDAETLLPAKRLAGRLRLLAAVRLGRTRLIDNIPLRIRGRAVARRPARS